MKNKSILFVFMLFASLHSISQTNKISVQGGVIATSFFSSSLPEQKIKLGDIYYLGYEFETERNLLLTAGLEYSSMGSTTKNEIINAFDVTTFESTMDFKYISLPIKIGKKIGVNWFGFGYLGVTNRFLIKATNDTPLFDLNFNQIGREKEDITQDVKCFDFSGIIDLGIGKRFAKHEIFLSCNFTFSAISFSTNSFFTGIKPKNYGGIIKIGYNYCF